MDIDLDETIKDFSEDYESNPRAVKKGVAIFKSGAVEYMPYDEGIISFFAKVPDDNSTVKHTAKVQLYKGSGGFVDGNCTCKPNREDKLLCKHIVAATLTIQKDMQDKTIRMEEQLMPKLLYQGHGSFRLTANDGRVIYVDPYVGEGYDQPAALILVTHQHGDHNKIELCAKKPDCRIITNAEALAGGKHNSFDIGGIKIEAVKAHNKNHDPTECVGFIITLDGVKIYASGDTSMTEQMKTFAAMNLDYAILCGDGVYNMNPAEAAECARLIGAKKNIIVHVKPQALFDREIAEAWDAPNKLIVEPGEEISL